MYEYVVFKKKARKSTKSFTCLQDVAINKIETYTVKFSYKDHPKLGPPFLLRPLVSEPKHNFQCKLISLMRSVHYRLSTSTISGLIIGALLYMFIIYLKLFNLFL